MKSITGLFIAIFIILVLSLSTIWSTIPSLAINQLTFILVATFFALIISRQNPNLLKSLVYPAYILTIFLLILTFILGELTRGSVRWISIGPFNLQTSEIAKPLLILTFANLFREPVHRPWSWLLTRVLFFLPIVLLVFLQPDLGSAIIISIVWIGMLAFSTLQSKYFLSLIILGVLFLPIGLQLLQPYQRERLTSFLHPYSDPSGSGYNVIQSQIAIGSGRLLGKGVRQGTQSHLRFLPERHTDFAFATFAEEFGFVGTTILLFSFATILFWLINHANQGEGFRNLIIVGTFWHLFSQLVINLGMNLGIMPVTGITLPLFSYGGSSLLSFGISFGLVLAVLQKER